jgi:hypothetical protein
MAGFAKPEIRLAQTPGWFDQLAGLLSRELAPNSRKLRTALRLATVGTIGAGLIASAHVNNELGTYIVWLLVGAGPMMSPRKAVAFLIAEAFTLAASVILAGILSETPWLMLPFLFALVSFTTYLGTTFKLGAALLLIQVTFLFIYYGVAYAPDEIGWSAAGEFGGSVIAFGTIVLFDNWIWPAAKRSCLKRWERASRALVRASSRLQIIIWIAGARRARRSRRRLRIFPRTWIF